MSALSQLESLKLLRKYGYDVEHIREHEYYHVFIVIRDIISWG